MDNGYNEVEVRQRFERLKHGIVRGSGIMIADATVSPEEWKLQFKKLYKIVQKVQELEICGNNPPKWFRTRQKLGKVFKTVYYGIRFRNIVVPPLVTPSNGT